MKDTRYRRAAGRFPADYLKARKGTVSLIELPCLKFHLLFTYFCVFLSSKHYRVAAPDGEGVIADGAVGCKAACLSDIHKRHPVPGLGVEIDL